MWPRTVRSADVGVAGLGDDLEAARALEHHAQPGAHDGVVVGKDNRDQSVVGRHGATIAHTGLPREVRGRARWSGPTDAGRMAPCRVRTPRSPS